MSPDDEERLWQLFLEECTKGTFSDKEIAEGKKHKSFLGGAITYRKMFAEAIRKLEQEKNQ